MIVLKYSEACTERKDSQFEIKSSAARNTSQRMNNVRVLNRIYTRTPGGTHESCSLFSRMGVATGRCASADHFFRFLTFPSQFDAKYFLKCHVVDTNRYVFSILFFSNIIYYHILIIYFQFSPNIDKFSLENYRIIANCCIFHSIYIRFRSRLN